MSAVMMNLRRTHAFAVSTISSSFQTQIRSSHTARSRSSLLGRHWPQAGTPATTTTPATSSRSSRFNSRLYSFNRFSNDDEPQPDNNNNNKKGFLAKLKEKAKEYLPFLRTEQEQQAAIEKARVKSELSSSIQQVLRDAPLPIRAMGSLVGSLLGSAMSEMAQAASQQGQLVDQYYEKAVAALKSNASVQSALGSPIQVGAITSQSSSTTSINGRSMTRLQLGFAVFGSRGIAGQAQLAVQTTNNNSDPPPTLQLQLSTGQILSIPMDGRSSTVSNRFSTTSSKWNSDNSDDSIIEAEIIEKKPSRS